VLIDEDRVRGDEAGRSGRALVRLNLELYPLCLQLALQAAV